jgi:hypothetical protein
VEAGTPLSQVQKVALIQAALLEFDGFEAQLNSLAVIEELLRVGLASNGSNGWRRMVTLSPHLFSLLILVSGVGATMVWLAARSSLIEQRHDVKRCAACGRLLSSRELCRCAEDRDGG